jgi:hypothetical protein
LADPVRSLLTQPLPPTPRRLAVLPGMKCFLGLVGGGPGDFLPTPFSAQGLPSPPGGCVCSAKVVPLVQTHGPPGDMGSTPAGFIPIAGPRKGRQGTRKATSEEDLTVCLACVSPSPKHPVRPAPLSSSLTEGEIRHQEER